LLVFHFITLTATNDNLRGNKIQKKKKTRRKKQKLLFPKNFFSSRILAKFTNVGAVVDGIKKRLLSFLLFRNDT